MRAGRYCAPPGRGVAAAVDPVDLRRRRRCRAVRARPAEADRPRSRPTRRPRPRRPAPPRIPPAAQRPVGRDVLNRRGHAAAGPGRIARGPPVGEPAQGADAAAAVGDQGVGRAVKGQEADRPDGGRPRPVPPACLGGTGSHQNRRRPGRAARGGPVARPGSRRWTCRSRRPVPCGRPGPELLDQRGQEGHVVDPLAPGQQWRSGAVAPHVEVPVREGDRIAGGRARAPRGRSARRCRSPSRPRREGRGGAARRLLDPGRRRTCGTHR